MADFIDRAIAVLRTHHDRLAEVVADLTPEQLKEPSAATEWSIAQVLSHLGSGAEIWLRPLRRRPSPGRPAPEQDNQAIWDRWNASSPEEQAAGFLEHDERFVRLLEEPSPRAAAHG